MKTVEHNLTSKQFERFIFRAKEMGFDEEHILKYGKGRRRASVATLDEIRDLLGFNNPELRKASSLAGKVPNSSDLRSLAEAYVFGGYELTSDQIFDIENHVFPIDILLEVAIDKTIPAGTTWVIARDAPPFVGSYGTLTLEPGANIEIYNTYLVLETQKLIRL